MEAHFQAIPGLPSRSISDSSNKSLTISQIPNIPNFTLLYTVLNTALFPHIDYMPVYL